MKFTAVTFALAAISSFTSAAPLERRRFAQEQAVGLGAKISAVSAGCPSNGDAALGFGGQEIGLLLAAANPCGKLELADKLVATAKTCPADVTPKLIAIAMELVAAEKNFNPFNGNADSVCLTAGLPASRELQGILQKVDPRDAPPNNNDAALTASAKALNDKAAQVLAAAQASGSGPGSGGKSMAQLLADNGFTAIQGFNGGAAPAPAPVADAPVADAPVADAPVPDAPVDNNAGNNNNAGGKNCNAQKLEVIVRGNEQRFGLGGQQVALNPVIPIERICNALRDAECKAICETAKDAAAATGVKGNSQGQGDLAAMQKLADDFNSALAGGVVEQVAPPAADQPVADDNNNDNQVGNAGGLGVCSADAAKLVVALGADPARADEVRFVPGGFQKDPIFGGQSSALNGGIIANFICDRLASDCKADAAVVTACNAAQTAVNNQRGGANLNDAQKQALGKVADTFNAAIGIITNFEVEIIGGVVGGNDVGNNNNAVGNAGDVDVAQVIELLKKALLLVSA